MLLTKVYTICSIRFDNFVVKIIFLNKTSFPMKNLLLMLALLVCGFSNISAQTGELTKVQKNQRDGLLKILQSAENADEKVLTRLIRDISSEEYRVPTKDSELARLKCLAYVSIFAKKIKLESSEASRLFQSIDCAVGGSIFVDTDISNAIVQNGKKVISEYEAGLLPKVRFEREDILRVYEAEDFLDRAYYQFGNGGDLSSRIPHSTAQSVLEWLFRTVVKNSSGSYSENANAFFSYYEKKGVYWTYVLLPRLKKSLVYSELINVPFVQGSPEAVEPLSSDTLIGVRFPFSFAPSVSSRGNFIVTDIDGTRLLWTKDLVEVSKNPRSGNVLSFRGTGGQEEKLYSLQGASDALRSFKGAVVPEQVSITQLPSGHWVMIFAAKSDYGRFEVQDGRYTCPTFGGHKIFYSISYKTNIESTSWTPPAFFETGLLGQERSPYIYGDTLFFAYKERGQSWDVYSLKLTLGEKQIQKASGAVPQKLSISSEADDFGYYPVSSGTFYVASRPDATGKLTPGIYFFKRGNEPRVEIEQTRPAPAKPKVSKPMDVEEGAISFALECVPQPVGLDTARMTITGAVFVKKDGKLVPVEGAKILFTPAGDYLASMAVSGKNGVYTSFVPDNVQISVQAEVRDSSGQLLYSHSDIISCDQGDNVYFKAKYNVKLEPLVEKKGDEVGPPILFSFNSATDIAGIDRVRKYYKALPKDVKSQDIEIVGYADYIGGDESNKTLSLSRANTIKVLLKSLGFTGEITVIAGGKTQEFNQFAVQDISYLVANWRTLSIDEQQRYRNRCAVPKFK